MNRRGSYRVYIGEQMTITAFTSQGAKKHSVHLKDISESGMAFLSKEEFDIGRIVRLNLSFNKGISSYFLGELRLSQSSSFFRK